MGWVKLDTGFFLHPKALAAGRDGRDLFLAALCWSAAQETDGRVAAHALPMVAACAGVADADQAASRLVEVGLWVNTPDGWAIHGYEEWQTTRAERESWRARERARKRTTQPADLPRGIRAEDGRNPRPRREENRREEKPPPPSEPDVYPQHHPQPVDNRAHDALLVVAELIARQNRAQTPARYAEAIVRRAEHLPALEELARHNPGAQPQQLANLLLGIASRTPCQHCQATTHNDHECPIGAST